MTYMALPHVRQQMSGFHSWRLMPTNGRKGLIVSTVKIYITGPVAALFHCPITWKISYKVRQ